MSSSSTLIKRMGRQDNPEAARPLTAAGEEQISWLNIGPPSQCQAGRREGLHPDGWTRRCGGGVYVAWQWSCHRMSEVSSSIWSHYHVKRRGWCLREGNRLGEEKSRKAICILQAHSFSHTHTPLSFCPPPPPQQAGQFTVRLFNFPEIGLRQLCHADEKV